MARSVKDAGMEELSALKKRVNRQHALERIPRNQRDDLVEMIENLEVYIVEVLDEKQEKKGGFTAW